MNSEPNLKWSDINSIPKILNDYINFRKKIKNTEDLFIRNDYIFSREDFLTNDYFLCEIILLLTALSKKAEIYMMKICDMSSDIQEFWADSISKYIEMRSIIDDDKSKIYDNQSIAISLNQQTPLELFKHLSKDKLSKMSSKKMFDNSATLNDNNSKFQISNQNNKEVLINNDLSKSHNILIDFEEQKNLLINMDNIKKKNIELLKENNNLIEKINNSEKINKRLISALKEENKELKIQLQNIINDKNKYEEMIKEKENEKIILLEKKINEYENEILKLNKIIKENETKYIKEKKLLETKLKLSENTLLTNEKYKEENNKLKEEMKKLENENIILKSYKEYKQKYEELLLNKEENMNQQIINYDIVNITETKEKLLSALKNNVNIQKDNERLRKEIISLKEVIKNNKKEIEKLEREIRRKKEGYVNLYENLDEKEKKDKDKDIDYKIEYEKMNIKAERYKYLLDNRDKQIEKLQKEIEKYIKKDDNKEKDKNINHKINYKLNINNNTPLQLGLPLEDENKNELNECEIDTENSYKSDKKPYKKINQKKKNNLDIKISLNSKDSYSKRFSNKTNDNININENIFKEDLTTIKSEKGNYNINNHKIIKNHSKSVKKKDKIIKNKKIKGNNLHSLASSNLSFKNQINNYNIINTDNIFNTANSVLNLNSSIKIRNANNLLNISDRSKEDNINININMNPNTDKKNNNKRGIRSSSNNKKNKQIQNSMKNINNMNNMIESNNIKLLLDKIYLSIKKDKKNQNEFITFLKKIDKELNMNLINTSNKKIGTNEYKKIVNNNNNININEELINEKNKDIKELKNQLNISRRRESDIKLKLTFLQSEKIKLEEEKIKLNEEIKRLNQKNSNIYSDLEYSKNSKKNISIYSDKNLIKNDIGRLTTNLNLSPKKDFESFEGIKSSDKNVISAEKISKYTFRKKKLLNKSPSLEAGNALSFKKLFSEEKKSNYEESLNDNKIENEENNTTIINYKSKIYELMNNNNNLTLKIKNLNEELENIKIKGNNLELINSNLIKENITLKKSLLIIKDNYDKEYSLVSASLINLTEKYQEIKKQLKQKNRDI